MTGTLPHVKVAPKGMGLNDFVAYEEGFYADEGIEVELDWKTFRGTQSSWKKYDYFQRPQDKPYAEGGSEQVVQCACVWERSATRAPAWAAWWPTATAFRPGRSSFARSRRSAGPKI